MTDSPTCSSPLHAALVGFQAEVTDVSKASQAKIQPRDKSKPAFGFPYADLATILDGLTPSLPGTAAGRVARAATMGR